MSIEEMERRYPNEYLFITDCVHNKNTELMSGVVEVHSDTIDAVYAASSKYKGHAAIHYTGELFPEGVVIL